MIRFSLSKVYRLTAFRQNILIMKLEIIVILCFLLFSCSNEKQNTKEKTETQNFQNDTLSEQIVSQDSVFEEIEIIDSSKIDKRTFDEKLLAFSDSMLRKPTNIWTDTYRKENEFGKDTASSYQVYGGVLSKHIYIDEESANKAFQLLKNPNVWADKSGEMVLQKENLIVALHKSCQNPPVPLKWKQYEQLFLKFVLEKNEEIEVLNTSCGKMKFKQEIRKRTD